jgi:ABC-type branched-subunit amino acid transport system ATPase component
VEQNVRLAMRLARTVYVLRNGSIVLEAPASQVDEDKLARSYLA